MALVPSKDMQISPLIGDENFLKDAHSADSNENSYFRFLVFELWLIVCTIYCDTPGVPPTKKKVEPCQN